MRLDSQEQGKAEREDDDFPRKKGFAAISRRSLSRIVMLLAALGGIVYLREKTGSIAGCMADAFRMPATAPPAKVRLAQPHRFPDGGVP